MLFNLYLNEIPFLLDREDTDPIVLPNGSRLNCLLYADDLVLISHSARGLEKALSVLSKFCDNWLLSVNPKKTKIMIFQKKFRKTILDKYLFQINNQNIDIVSNYTYLGINFSNNGNFKFSKLNSKDKVRRSFFATRRYLDFSKVSLDLTNKLFNSLFLPILLYGSEVWGVYDKDNLSTWEKDVIEKTHIFLCKQSLGVNKQCPNVAARNELGRLSLKLNIDTSILKFWIHLQTLPENNIAKQCLQISKEMADINQPGLSQKIKVLCKKFNSSSMVLNDNCKEFINHLNQNIHKALINHQLSLLNSNRKLCFYNFFKKDTKQSVFLDAIINPLHRTAINKFRLGNHQLRIETGRHTVPKTPENLRLCTLCQGKDVENESHALFSCTFYDSFRSKFFYEITGKYQFFGELDINSKILFLFNSIDPFICRSVAAFVYEIMNSRYKKLYNK